MINSDFEAIIRDVRLNLESKKSLEFKEPNDLNFGQRVFWDRLQEQIDCIDIETHDNDCSLCTDRTNDQIAFVVEFIDGYLSDKSKVPRQITILSFVNNDKSCGISAFVYDNNRVDCFNDQLKNELDNFIENNSPIDNMEVFVGRQFADFECMDCTVSWYFEAEYKEQLKYRA